MPDTSISNPPPATVRRRRRFSCRRSDDGSAVRLAVAGELDIATAPELDGALRTAEIGAALVVLDLRELNFIDCTAGHLMLTADRRIREAGGRLVVVCGSGGCVERFFALVGIDRELDLVDRPPAQASATAVLGAAPRPWAGGYTDAPLDSSAHAADAR